MRNRIRNQAVLAVVAVLAVLLAACNGGADDTDTTATADDATDAGTADDGTADGTAGPDGWPDQTITLVVPRSAGGGYDVYGRAFAQVFEQYLPDGANVVVENVTGAGGRIAAADLTNADPDGYMLMITDPEGLMSFELVEDTEYAIDDWATFGTITVRPSTFAVAIDSPLEDFEDFREAARERSLTYSTTDTTSPAFLEAMFVMEHEEMQAETPTVVPHEGSPEAFTSVIRGDTDFIAFSIDSVAPYVDDGELRPLIHFSQEPLTDIIGDTPIGADYGMGDLDGTLQTSLVIYGPPGMDPDLEAFVRDIVEATLFSDELATWGEEQNRLVTPLDTQATLDRVADRRALYEGNIGLLEQFLAP